MRQARDCSKNKENRLFCIALKTTRGVVVLILLTVTALLRAQSNECRTSRGQCGPRVEPPANSTFSDLPVAVVFNAVGGSTAMRPAPATASPALFNPTAFVKLCRATTHCADWFYSSPRLLHSIADPAESPADHDKSGGSSKPPSILPLQGSNTDFNQSIYYRNRLEFSLDGGWLPINIPFVFDVFLGDSYNKTPLNYTLVPIIVSLRWQLDDVGGPWILRGNWDLTTSGAVTVIPRGPETRYFAWIMGIRRNFVPRRGRIAPYFDGRLGLGGIDAKGPFGVLFAQGQDFTFTMNMGAGMRYNFNPRYSISAGLNWMHISNLYLSEPQFSNYGINVYGPMFGIDVRLGKPHPHSSE